MRFINPKTDFAFKKIFGSDQSHFVLISFLNGILYDGTDHIQSLDILNPYQAPKVQGLKDSYLDVKAELADGTSVIIEMQVLNVVGFEKRILYNAAKSYSTQLKTGDDYTLLNPVIGLTVTDFVMFPELADYRSCFILKEKEKFFDYPSNDLELVFVELPKFDKSLEQLSNLMEQWLFFLQNARQLEGIPQPMEQIPAIRQAFELANLADLSPAELEDFERREMFFHDQRNAMKFAIQQAQKQAQEQSREALEQEKLRIAQELLPMLSDEAISQATGLSVAEVNSLRLSE